MFSKYQLECHDLLIHSNIIFSHDLDLNNIFVVCLSKVLHVHVINISTTKQNNKSIASKIIQTNEQDTRSLHSAQNEKIINND